MGVIVHDSGTWRGETHTGSQRCPLVAAHEVSRARQVDRLRQIDRPDRGQRLSVFRIHLLRQPQGPDHARTCFAPEQPRHLSRRFGRARRELSPVSHVRLAAVGQRDQRDILSTPLQFGLRRAVEHGGAIQFGQRMRQQEHPERTECVGCRPLLVASVLQKAVPAVTQNDGLPLIRQLRDFRKLRQHRPEDVRGRPPLPQMMVGGTVPALLVVSELKGREPHRLQETVRRLHRESVREDDTGVQNVQPGEQSEGCGHHLLPLGAGQERRLRTELGIHYQRPVLQPPVDVFRKLGHVDMASRVHPGQRQVPHPVASLEQG